MSLILKTKITPLYGLIELFDSPTKNIAQRKTGEESVVSSPDYVSVSTKSDSKGDVEVTIWKGEIQSDNLQLIFNKEFSFRKRLVVGNSIINQLFDIQLPPGAYQLKIYILKNVKIEEIDKVYFAFLMTK